MFLHGGRWGGFIGAGVSAQKTHARGSGEPRPRAGDAVGMRVGDDKRGTGNSQQCENAASNGLCAGRQFPFAQFRRVSRKIIQSRKRRNGRVVNDVLSRCKPFERLGIGRGCSMALVAILHSVVALILLYLGPGCATKRWT